MIKQPCTMLLIWMLNIQVSGQSTFSIMPNPASVSGALEEKDILVHAEITNLTGDTLHLHWERQIISLSPGCTTNVFDPFLGWAQMVGAHDLQLYPHLTGEFSVGFYTPESPCAGIVHLRVTNLDNPADTLTGIYLLNQSSATEQLPAAGVKLFPNPATTFFSLENAEEAAAIRLLDLSGRELAHFNASGTNTYSLQNIPAGAYAVLLADKNGRTYQVMELHKQ